MKIQQLFPLPLLREQRTAQRSGKYQAGKHIRNIYILYFVLAHQIKCIFFFEVFFYSITLGERQKYQFKKKKSGWFLALVFSYITCTLYYMDTFYLQKSHKQDLDRSIQPGHSLKQTNSNDNNLMLLRFSHCYIVKDDLQLQ